MAAAKIPAPNPFDPSFSYENDKNLFLFTSLTAGSSHIISATSRMETILKANRVPYYAIDCATDDKARRLWARRARGKRFPGLVKEGMVLGDLETVEEWNEFGEIKIKLGGAPLPKKPAVKKAAANKENTAPAVASSAAVPAADAPPPAPALPTSAELPIRTKESQPADAAAESAKAEPAKPAGQASLASEVAAAALKRKQDKAAALRASRLSKAAEAKPAEGGDGPSETKPSNDNDTSTDAKDKDASAPDPKLAEEPLEAAPASKSGLAAVTDKPEAETIQNPAHGGDDAAASAESTGKPTEIKQDEEPIAKATGGEKHDVEDDVPDKTAVDAPLEAAPAAKSGEAAVFKADETEPTAAPIKDEIQEGSAEVDKASGKSEKPAEQVQPDIPTAAVASTTTKSTEHTTKDEEDEEDEEEDEDEEDEDEDDDDDDDDDDDNNSDEEKDD